MLKSLKPSSNSSSSKINQPSKPQIYHFSIKIGMKYWQCHYPSICYLPCEGFKQSTESTTRNLFSCKKISWLRKGNWSCAHKENLLLQNCTHLKKSFLNCLRKVGSTLLESFIPLLLSLYLNWRKSILLCDLKGNKI